MAQPFSLAKKEYSTGITQTNAGFNRIKHRKERVMMIKYTSGENHLCMEARVRFSEGSDY